MQKIHKRLAPNQITELSQCEIFVFGSNLEGLHMGGAARYAYDHFGAEWGNGVGPQGQCYAIPTMHGPLSDIKPYVDDFIEYARQHPMNRFLLTRIGCGIAGFKDKDMAPLFKEALNLPNVSFPNEWFIQLLDYVEPREKRKQATPPVINMDVLKRLCKEHLYTIGAGIPWDEPDLLIRYVIAEDKFGYKAMGNFFFLEDTLYVWDFDDAWAPDHNADIVEEIFYDECKGRGYAHRVLFAGVKTPYKDSKGESIFTGDVCHIKFHGSEYDFPLTTLGWEENPEHFRYAFVLDNHCIHPEECESITRVGTVFYMLKPNDDGNMVDEKSAEFTDIYGQNPSHRAPPGDGEVHAQFPREILGIRCPEGAGDRVRLAILSRFSDEGMSAFLRCVQLLHVFDTNGRIESLDNGRTIFPYKEISFQAIYDCFKAYKRLYILDYSGRKDLSYKYTEFTQQNLFVILPVLYYCKLFPDSSDVDIQRVWHLFFNIKRYADLSRPVEPINKAIRVVSEMGTKDVLCLKDNDTLGDISNQDEERPKLRMISSNDEINRTRIELVLSDAESQELFNGRISILLKWANNNIDFVESYLDRIKLLWVESTETDRDILRSALLARGISNYPLPQGSHQSLGYSWKQWFEIISKNEDSIKAFLDDNRTLNSMIMDFGDTTPFYSIIKNPTLLSSSYYKNVRKCENKILILLEKERASADFSILWDNIQYQKYELGGNWEYLWEYAGLLFSDHREYNLTIDFFKTDSGYKTQIWRGKYPNKKAFIFLHEMASVLSLKSVEGKGLECWETEPMPPEKAKETMRKIASWVTGKEVE